MDAASKMEGRLSSAAAFVEGGAQDPCDDACSICLESFCDSNPSTLPVGTPENELEESIIQHLAAAASMSRAQHMARRERLMSADHMRGQLLYLSTNPNAPPMSSVSASSPQREEDEPALRRTVEEVPPLNVSQAQQVTDISSGSNIVNRSPFFNRR
ncbi:E3 ubiquitin-protein ligase RHF2A [Platanthera guangdongensis]|uniref:E3 ubiquitin-protein ligase RHF2A n=1 Tax=Platanthera guangdongensis TaxID=2320717 RepID=A0ABR2LIT3_9ASPA